MRACPSLDRLPRVAAASVPQEQRLEAEYYDTDDLRLIRAGITLRRRSGGDDAGWHLKLPLGAAPAGRSGGRSAARRTGTRGTGLPGARAHPRRAAGAGRPDDHDRQRLILLDEAGKSLAEVAADDVSAQALGPAHRGVPDGRRSRWS